MSSIYYSLIESAKMNNLDIHSYLEYILEEIQNNVNIEFKDLTPYSESLPEKNIQIIRTINYTTYIVLLMVLLYWRCTVFDGYK